MKYIDLHTHSTCSDGTFTPSELAACAAEKGLAAFALTDHDTTEGLKEAAAAAAGRGVEFVPGIEFSTDWRGRDIHIVGLDIRPDNPQLKEKLYTFRRNRDARNEEMLSLLQKVGGFDISMDALRADYGEDTVITRAHFGRWLFEHGCVRSISEAFALYLGDGCPCFVEKKRTRPETAIRLILGAGGIPVLAHPLLYHLSTQELEELAGELKEYGLAGIEAIYSTNLGLDESRMRRFARKMGLKISGGSDFHGKNKPLIEMGSGRGNLKIPYEVLEELRKCKAAE